MTPTLDNIRDYYDPPIRADSFWICLLAQLKPIWIVMCPPASPPVSVVCLFFERGCFFFLFLRLRSPLSLESVIFCNARVLLCKPRTYIDALNIGLECVKNIQKKYVLLNIPQAGPLRNMTTLMRYGYGKLTQ